MTFCIYQHVDGEATEVPSIPIHFYWIFGFDEVLEVEDIIDVCVLDTKIIDGEDERKGFCEVFPYTWVVGLVMKFFEVRRRKIF